MASYAADGLAASGEPAAGGVLAPELARAVAAAEAAEPGSGPAVLRVILLVRNAGRLAELDAMETLAVEESRRIGRECLQLALDGQAFAECWLPGVTGSDGVLRPGKADSSRSLLSLLGHVTVRRAAYLPGKGGVPALHPRDAVLNLPPGGFTWQFRKLAEITCRSGTYSSAAEVASMVTGTVTGGRQLREIMEDCAADAEEFAKDRPVRDPPVLKDPDGTETAVTGVASADAKGVSMLKDSLRKGAARKAAGKDCPVFRKLGSGEKSGNKRMAETCVVYDCLPPEGEPRTPEEIMRRPRSEPGRHPRALNRAYSCDIVSTCADSIRAGVFAEIDRRDPLRLRQWIGLVDGNNDQIRSSARKPRNGAWTCLSSSTSSTFSAICGKPAGASSPPGTSPPPRPGSPTGARRSSSAGPPTSPRTSAAGPPPTRPDPAASTPGTSARPSPT